MFPVDDMFLESDIYQPAGNAVELTSSEFNFQFQHLVVTGNIDYLARVSLLKNGIKKRMSMKPILVRMAKPCRLLLLQMVH